MFGVMLSKKGQKNTKKCDLNRAPKIEILSVFYQSGWMPKRIDYKQSGEN